MPTPPRFPRPLLEALDAAGVRVGDELTPEAIDRLSAALAEAEAVAGWRSFEATLPAEQPAVVTGWPGPFIIST